tara:strand:+ start:263 stop:1144 length:882 start_codon:yes stop_codon:yes gene_type:complete
MGIVSYELGTFEKIYETINHSEDFRLSDSEKNICRFCGETDINKFKSKAHVVPEFTGARILYKCECDSCNNLFSKYERDLSLFGGIKNIISGVKGKKFPKHIDRDNKFYAQSNKERVFQIFSQGENDGIKIQNGQLELSSMTQKFRPRFVQKALVKIGMSLMPQEELYKFSKTLEWLAVPQDNFSIDKHPMSLLLEREVSVPQKKPLAILSRRTLPQNSPEYFLLFFYSFFAYQLSIPFNENDTKLDYSNLSYPISKGVVVDFHKPTGVKFNHYYMSSLKSVQIEDKFRSKLK